MHDFRPIRAGNSWPPAGTGTPMLADGEAERGSDLRRVLGILSRRKWIIAAGALFATAATALLLRFEQPIYWARAVIRLEDTQRALAGGLDAGTKTQLTGRGSPDFMLSQLEVLRSAQVLGQVVDRAGLRLVPLDNEFRASSLVDVRVAATVSTDTITIGFEPTAVLVSDGTRGLRAAYDAPVELAGVSFRVPRAQRREGSVRLAVQHRQQAINRLARMLQARPRTGTDAIEIDYRSTDRELSARVVNTAVEAFRERNIEAARQESRRRRLFLEGQVAQADAQLIGAQEKLTQFRSRERVYSSSEWFAATQSSLMELDVRREELNANRATYRSILQGLNATGSEVQGSRIQSLMAAPEIAGNPAIASHFTQLLAYESARDSLVSGPWRAAATHPDVIRLSDQIRTTSIRLAAAARSHLETLDAQARALDGLRSETSASLATLPEVEVEQTRLVGAVYSAQRTVDQLRDEYQRARIAEAVEAGQVNVIDLATVPLAPERAYRSRKLATGLLLGLILGCAGAFLREALNTRIRQRDEMEQVLHVASVGVIPQIPGSAAAAGVPVITRVRALIGRPAERSRPQHLMTAQDGTPYSEAFRTIRTNLLFSSAVRSLRTLVVTSATPEEGKTTTAANLAIAYAQQGLRVLLVDCDLRRARLHKVLGYAREPGLTDFLLGRVPWEDVRQDGPLPNLDFLASGVLPHNPSELLGGPRMQEALATLPERYDLVVLDTPPIVAGPDAAILGSICDAVVLVVRAGRTEREAGQQAVRQLQAVGARVVGAVLNDPDGELPRYSSYYAYQYKYQPVNE